MRHVIAGLLGAFAISGAAYAADMPVKAIKAPIVAAYDWSGFYVGINGGGGWGRSRFDYASGTSTGNFNTSGGLLGGTAGYNWQTQNFVIGVEGDLDWTNISGTGLAPNPAYTARTSNNWLATVRGRLGYAMNNWLFYGTGGVAFGDVKADYPVNPAAPAYPGQTMTRTGYVLGGGIEYGLTRSWTVKAEYLYVDLGTATCSGPNCETIDTKIPFSANIGRLGVNYRF